jgi:L-threonylcarbamoyladenylate synthase
MTDELDRAADALRSGKLVVYPTETVYGLGADALDATAVEAVFEAKGRDRSNPISMAVPDVETAVAYTNLSPTERQFMEAFLPGPVTVVLDVAAALPDVLTAGTDRIGIRIPDHERALQLLDRVSPVTATSANVSGAPSTTSVQDLDDRIREAAAVVIDAGETPGGGSTVVDVSQKTVHRRGARASAVESWLDKV